MDKKPEYLANLEKKHYVIYEVNFQTMLDIVDACKDLQIQRTPSSPYPNANITTTINMWSLLKGIIPGTKWCGINDLANNYHDLGAGGYFEVDKCCRSHDHCPVKVHSFTSNYGATNYHPYTK